MSDDQSDSTSQENQGTQDTQDTFISKVKENKYRIGLTVLVIIALIITSMVFVDNLTESDDPVDPPDEPTDPVDPPETTVEVSVEDGRSGEPISDATILIDDTELSINEQEQIDAGEYDVTVTAENYNQLSETVEVTEGQNNTFIFTLLKEEREVFNCESVDSLYGDGTEENPYLITDAYDLECMLSSSHDNLYFEQYGEIDATPLQNSAYPEDDGKGGLEYDNEYFTAQYEFTGTYDGNGYTITNMDVKNPLFVTIAESATVKNLGIEKFEDASEGSGYDPVLASRNNGTITNVYLIQELGEREPGEQGGLVKTNNGVFTNSYSVIGFYGDNPIGVGVPAPLMYETRTEIATSLYYDSTVAGDTIQIQDRGNRTDPDDYNTVYEVNQTGLTTEQMTGEQAQENMTQLDFESTWKTTDTYPKLIKQQPTTELYTKTTE